MVRTQLQIDESTYEALRRRAFREGRSMAAVIRDLIEQGLSEKRPRMKPTSIASLRFIGSGRSRTGKRDRVSERHDEILGDALRR